MPVEQVVQVVLEVLLLKYPWGQLVHIVCRARVALNVPGTHSEHVVEPWEAAYVPAGQVWHVVSLVVLLKVPLGHGEHVVALNRYRPGMQGRQKACSSSGWCWPASHTSQEDAPTSLKNPCGHCLHPVALETSLYRPALQLTV